MAVKGWHGYGAGIVRRRRGMVMPAVSPWKWRGTPPHRPGRVSSPGKPVKTATCCVTRSLPFSLSFALLLSLCLFSALSFSLARAFSLSLSTCPRLNEYIPRVFIHSSSPPSITVITANSAAKTRSHIICASGSMKSGYREKVELR